MIDFLRTLRFCRILIFPTKKALKIMITKFFSVVFLGVTMAATSLSALAEDSKTLAQIKAKGFIQCGVSQGLAGFSESNADGWSGIDVDFCRSVAAAVFGDDTKVKYTPLSGKERFAALTSGEIDLLSRNTTWTATRDTQRGFNFAGVIYYDGQGFMVRKDLGVSSALELSGATICANTGTTTELNVADFFTSNNMDYELVVFEKSDEVVAAYDSKRCDAYTTDASGLYAQRLKLADPQSHTILPEMISKEPLGPIVRQGDDQWFNIVRWTLFALLNAEEMGVSSQNAEKLKSSTENPAIKRLLGTEAAFGEGLGLSNDWAFNIISKVGNYAEIYDANLGPKTPLGIERGINALWTNKGIHYAPPIR